jgi:hypothetical protein
MKKLTPDQLIFANRVITETMVQAQMGKLTRWTSLSTNTSPILSAGTSLALSTTELLNGLVSIHNLQTVL